MREYFLNRIYGEYQSYKASVLEENSGSIYARFCAVAGWHYPVQESVH